MDATHTDMRRRCDHAVAELLDAMLAAFDIAEVRDLEREAHEAYRALIAYEREHWTEVG